MPNTDKPSSQAKLATPSLKASTQKNKANSLQTQYQSLINFFRKNKTFSVITANFLLLLVLVSGLNWLDNIDKKTETAKAATNLPTLPAIPPTPTSPNNPTTPQNPTTPTNPTPPGTPQTPGTPTNPTTPTPPGTPGTPQNPTPPTNPTNPIDISNAFYILPDKISYNFAKNNPQKFGREDLVIKLFGDTRFTTNNLTATCKFRIKFFGFADNDNIAGYAVTRTKLVQDTTDPRGQLNTTVGTFEIPYDTTKGCSVKLPKQNQNQNKWSVQYVVQRSDGQIFAGDDSYFQLFGAIGVVRFEVG